MSQCNQSETACTCPSLLFVLSLSLSPAQRCILEKYQIRTSGSMQRPFISDAVLLHVHAEASVEPVGVLALLACLALISGLHQAG